MLHLDLINQVALFMNLRKACLLGCKLFYSYLRPSTPYLFTVVKIYIYIYIGIYIICVYIYIYIFNAVKRWGEEGLDLPSLLLNFLQKHCSVSVTFSSMYLFIHLLLFIFSVLFRTFR